MISEVVMPQMGADMVEGTILHWRKHEGDPVERGEIIAEIETDKANVEIEAFRERHLPPRDPRRGRRRADRRSDRDHRRGRDDISQYTNGAAPPVAAPAAASAATAPAQVAAPSEAEAGERQRVSPVARRIAEERGIDLAQVRGTGPDGRIIKRDVESFAAAPPQPARATTPVSASPQPLGTSRMRQAIARRMSQSKREAPHYYLLVDIDMTAAMAFRRRRMRRCLKRRASASTTSL